MFIVCKNVKFPSMFIVKKDKKNTVNFSCIITAGCVTVLLPDQDPSFLASFINCLLYLKSAVIF